MLVRAGLFSLGVALFSVPLAPSVFAQGTELSDRAKARDANKNGVIDRNEAAGPIKDNFNEMDCNKSGTLDGAEIKGFFTGEGCPKSAATKPAPVTAPQKAATGAAKPKGGRPPRAVRVDAVISEPLSQTYPVIGRLVAQRTGDVAARINGAVVEMNVSVAPGRDDRTL